MDRLSSCYFCGVAHDESLSEYPVVPKQLHPREQTQQTVVLCSTCRRKLATVVETVVTAARADQGRREGEPNSDKAADDDTSALLDESGLDPQPDPTAVSDANETPVEDSHETGADAAAEDPPAESAGETGDGGGDDEREGADAAAAPGRDPGEPANGGDAIETGQEASTRDDAAASEEPSTAMAGEDTASSDGDDDQATLTRLEYSKVMRLLQNRPFPGDRGEIREVAVNAYDIDPEQFDAITEAAIERGLIGEEDGQFVSAE